MYSNVKEQDQTTRKHMVNADEVGIENKVRLIYKMKVLFLMLSFVGILGLSGCQSTTGSETGFPDGDYMIDIELQGGSGRASIDSPTKLRIDHQKYFLTVTFHSPNYDYIISQEEKYLPVNQTGNSSFEFPVKQIDGTVPIIADTVAMSTPHEIEYRLILNQESLTNSETGEQVGKKETSVAEGTKSQQGDLDGNNAENISETGNSSEEEAAFFANREDMLAAYEKMADQLLPELEKTGTRKLSYANWFHIDEYEGGYKLLQIHNTGNYLFVPEGKKVPEGLSDSITVICQEPKQIYLLATSAMDLFRALDGIDHITLCGTAKDQWYIEEARQAMESGSLIYAGKYNAPDYELILSKGCDLAIESTMIYHNPEVKEKLESVGIPVMVERSSYEDHPLGRLEWIKVYGLLLGKEELAEQIFDEQVSKLSADQEQDVSLQKQTVVFFSINTDGSMNVRRSGDYITKMIEMAGGTYAFDSLALDKQTSTIRISMESFYSIAKDSDILIYNSAIEGELQGIDELLSKNSLFAEFKAVKEGKVWCTGQNLFQESSGICDLILDFERVIQGENLENMVYLKKLS